MLTMQNFRRWISFCAWIVLYKELRKKYINKYYWQRPNMVKLIELVRSENETTLKRLSMYLEKAFKLRHDCLYS